MNSERIVAALLKDATITAVVGDRVALERLPQGTKFPAIVYSVVTQRPEPNLNYSDKPRVTIRVQVNPFAPTIQQLKDLHEVVRAVLDFRHNIVVDGKTIITSRLEFVGPLDKDDDAGVWTQPADFVLTYIE